MEITETGYDLSNMIENIVHKEVHNILTTAQSEAFFEWMKQEIGQVVWEKGYQDRSPNDPEMQKWIVELLEKGVNQMIHNVVDGHRLIMKEDK